MQAVSPAALIAGTRVGFGCAGLMREPSARGRQNVLEAAFDHGVRHFDVARMYGLGAAEGELGRFAKSRRGELVIATKFGIEPSSAPGRLGRMQGPARRMLARAPALRAYVKRRSDSFHQPHRYDSVTARRSLETSLRELRTDYVDILFLHGPSREDAIDLPEICAYLEDMRQAGHLRAWGLSGERDACLAIMRSLPSSAILQIREDIFSRTQALTAESGLSIAFGVLSSALGRIVDHVRGSPERRDRWWQAVGADCTSTDAVASMLLCDALKANPHGAVLFSSTRPERVAGLVDAVSLMDEQDRALMAFRRLVGEELMRTRPAG